MTLRSRETCLSITQQILRKEIERKIDEPARGRNQSAQKSHLRNGAMTGVWVTPYPLQPRTDSRYLPPPLVHFSYPSMRTGRLKKVDLLIGLIALRCLKRLAQEVVGQSVGIG